MKLTRITEKTYNDNLGVLPPAAMSSLGFLVGEPTTHDKDGNPVYASYFKLPTSNAFYAGPNMNVAEFKAVTSNALTASAEDAEVPEKVQTELDLREQYGDDAVDAYMALGVADNLDDFEESYVGEFDSNEDFAQDMAENVGALNKDVAWPYTCIDWSYAARELMYDYSEENGHYFRNL